MSDLTIENYTKFWLEFYDESDIYVGGMACENKEELEEARNLLKDLPFVDHFVVYKAKKLLKKDLK